MVMTRYGRVYKGQAVWKGRDGATHWAVGDDVHRGIRVMWAACATGEPSQRPGSLDIPANGAWVYREGIDVVDCQACLDSTEV